MEKKPKKLPWDLGRLFLVLFVLVTGVVFIFLDKHEEDFNVRCSAETQACLVDENIEEYLYAPYHGGRVVTRYNTHLTYVVDFGSVSYSIKLSMPGKKVAPITLPVKYNPDDVSEFMYCTEELNYVVGDDEWVYYTGE